MLNQQVHADSSNFAAGVSKQDAYEQVIEQAKALFDGQRNWVCSSARTTEQGMCANSSRRYGTQTGDPRVLTITSDRPKATQRTPPHCYGMPSTRYHRRATK